MPVPELDRPVKRERIVLTGDVPSPMNPPEGCRFNPRCRYATERCRAERPILRALPDGRQVACHYPARRRGETRGCLNSRWQEPQWKQAHRFGRDGGWIRMAKSSPMAERVRVREVRVLSDDWYLLKKTTLDYKRRDGSWQTLNRETYDRGNGAAILLYDPARGTVLLIRQFRYPAFVNGHPEPLIEVPAGLLDELSPEEAIRREAEEEAGCRVAQPRRVFEAFMSPGSVTERLVYLRRRIQRRDPHRRWRRTGGGGRGHRGPRAHAWTRPWPW